MCLMLPACTGCLNFKHLGARTCRALAAAAHSLSQLAKAAQPALAQPASQRHGLLSQIAAGCTAVTSCLTLAEHVAALSPQAAFKLGSACSLILGAGRAVILACHLTATEGTTASMAAKLPYLVCSQLTAIFTAMSQVLSPSRQPQAAAAFTRSTANPATLLAWLRLVSEVLPHTLASAAPGECAGRHLCLW